MFNHSVLYTVGVRNEPPQHISQQYANYFELKGADPLPLITLSLNYLALKSGAWQ